MGNKVFHIFLRCQKNNIRFLNSWSAIEEIGKSLNLYETSHKVEVIDCQLKSMSTSARSKKLYRPEAIVRAFSYFATSRSLYKQMREDYQFPSISTLTKITSFCANQTSGAFLKMSVIHLKLINKKFVFCYMMRSILKNAAVSRGRSLWKS